MALLLYTKHTGQLCNRIWMLLPAISYAINFDKRIFGFFFASKYLRLFPNLAKSKNISFYLSTNSIDINNGIKIIWAIFTVLRVYATCKLEEISTSKFKIIDISGWDHRYDKSFIGKNKNEILKLFTPEERVQTRIKEILINRDKTIYVGIHIRRGDYKYWMNGRYYFSDTEYLDIIHKTFIKIKDKNQTKRIKFIICSNDKFNIQEFDLNGKIKVEDIKQIDNSEFILDLYLLANCDYILGPPSSFSQ